jgi:hypothetical protein
LALAGMTSYFFSKPVGPHQPETNSANIYVGSGLFLSAFLMHGLILPGMLHDLDRYPNAAFTRLAWGIGYLGWRGWHDSRTINSEHQANYIATMGGMWPYAIDRNFGHVREFTADPNHLPAWRELAPVWFANQVSSAALEFSSIALMAGARYTAMGFIDHDTQAGEILYQHNAHFLHYTMLQYAPAAAGSLSSAICSTAMTYAFPGFAALPGSRIPCHLLRLGARMGTRYSLLVLMSTEQSWAQDKADFWDEAPLYLLDDTVSAFLMQRWWTKPANAYMSDLGAFGTENVEHHLHVVIHNAPGMP